jgi:hypothetical protein
MEKLESEKFICRMSIKAHVLKIPFSRLVCDKLNSIGEITCTAWSNSALLNNKYTLQTILGGWKHELSLLNCQSNDVRASNCKTRGGVQTTRH